MITTWLKSLDPETTYFLDLETTGVASHDEPIEIGICDFEEREILSTLIKPTVNIHPKAYDRHKIGYDLLVNAPLFLDISEEIKSLIDGKTLVAYNAQFDKRILNQTFLKFDLKCPSSEWTCLMTEYKNTYKKQPSLESLCVEFGVKPGQHRAFSDALALCKLAKEFKLIYGII